MRITKKRVDSKFNRLVVSDGWAAYNNLKTAGNNNSNKFIKYNYNS